LLETARSFSAAGAGVAAASHGKTGIYLKAASARRFNKLYGNRFHLFQQSLLDHVAYPAVLKYLVIRC
jgi:hypothetical protein